MRIQATFQSQLRRALSAVLAPDGAMSGTSGACHRLPRRTAVAPPHPDDRTFNDLIMLLRQHPNAADLVCRLGRWMIRPTAFGELSLALLLAPTVADALRAAARFYRTEVPLVDFCFHETPAEGRFTIGFRRPVSGPEEALLVAFCVCMTEGTIERLTGTGGNVRKLKLTSSSAGLESTYRQYLCLTPETGHTRNDILLDRATLDYANPHADVDTFASALSVFTAREDLHGAGGRLEHRVREWVMANVSTPPSMDRMAALLRMSPRQLRRALAEEGTNYRAILRLCRTAYAMSLLHNPTLTLADVAQRLGYSDVAGLSHAFSRWAGQSPIAFRRAGRRGATAPPN